MNSFKEKLTHPATAIAFVALVVALAGTAIAGQQGQGLSRKEIVKLIHRLSNKQISKRAPKLSVAHAAAASDSQALGGRGADSFASSQLEAVHLVGTPGEPLFENGWDNFSDHEQSAGFWEDPLGSIHLQGLVVVSGEGGTPAFKLPPQFRPAQSAFMPATRSASPAVVTVEVNGDVKPFCKGSGFCEAGLDGTSFRIR